MIGAIIIAVFLWALWSNNNGFVVSILGILLTYTALLSRLFFGNSETLTNKLMRGIWNSTLHIRWRAFTLTAILTPICLFCGYLAKNAWHIPLKVHLAFNGSDIEGNIDVTIKTSETLHKLTTGSSSFSIKLSRKEASEPIFLTAENELYRTKNAVKIEPSNVFVPLERKHNLFVAVTHTEDRTINCRNIKVNLKEIAPNGKVFNSVTDSSSTAYFEGLPNSRWIVTLAGVDGYTYISNHVSISNIPHTINADLANDKMWSKKIKTTPALSDLQKAKISSETLSKRVIRAQNTVGIPVTNSLLLNCDLHGESHFLSWLPNTKRLLSNKSYITSYSDRFKIPLWTAYYMTGSRNNLRRPSSFEVDNRLPENFRSNSTDYKLSGYDRGHLCGNSDMAYFGQLEMKEAFLLSNITPQKPQVNRYVLSDIERFGRSLVTPNEKIYVISGSILFDDNNNSDKFNILTIGEGEVAVPTHFFRIYIRLENNQPYVIAFVVPQTADHTTEMLTYLATIDDIEAMTGHDFFRSLPDELENRIESQIDWDRWNNE